jgi:hypothetical protein
MWEMVLQKDKTERVASNAHRFNKCEVFNILYPYIVHTPAQSQGMSMTKYDK